MYERFATRIRQQMGALVDQYDARLSAIAGYAALPTQARRDLAQHVLTLVADCLDSGDDRALIDYIHDRGVQVLAHDFEPEWFQQAVAIAQDIITPLVQNMEESNFAWRTMSHAQTTVWEIVAAERRRIASSLRESELRYQTIFDSTPIMFWLKDARNRTLRINRAAAELEGVNPSDVEGQSAYDLYPREQAEAFYQDDLEVIRSGKPKLGIVEQHTSVGAGKLMWLETGKTPVRDDAGEIVGVLAFAVDITERKQLEQRIQESLDRRERQVQTSTEVAQEIAAAPELSELFHRVVTLIKERFNYYHAQLFRYELAQDAVVLVSGYGEAGKKMLNAGHQLRLGSGVVGTAAATGRAVLSPDVKLDPDWQLNPNLPDTQGELAVPIKWRDQILGILDVQSDQAGALTQDDQLLLEGLCGQIASAMESTRLLDSVQRSEQLMRTLIDAIPDYIYAKDLEGRHILGNAALARLYGMTTTELVGKTDFDFYPRELAEQYRVSELPILRKGNMLLAHEEPNIDAAGNLKWNSTTKVPLRDPQGQIIGLVGITSDVTQRKQAEADLRKFKLGLDRSTAAIFITETNGVITYVNPAFEKVYGFTREEAIGQTPRIIKSGLIPQEQYQHFWQALLAGQTVAGEIVNKTKDGRLISIEGSNSAIMDETGNVSGFLALHNDITERKRAEQRMEETLRETERLYAAVSHEGWQAYRQMGELPEGLLYDQVTLQPMTQLPLPAIQQAVQQRQIVTVEAAEQVITAVPLTVRGEIIGALGVYDDSGRPPASDDLALVQAVSEQVALALESARLFAQTQLALAETQAREQRERILREVTARVRSSTDPDMIMRILARELSTVLDRPTIVHLNIDADQAKVQARMPGGQAMSEGDN